jgi:hypothetical protein
MLPFMKEIHQRSVPLLIVETLNDKIFHLAIARKRLVLVVKLITISVITCARKKHTL